MLGLVVGVALLVVGVMVRLPIVGVVGFAAMFAGALVLIAPPRRLTTARHGGPAPHGQRPSFMDSLGERWERRNEENDR